MRGNINHAYLLPRPRLQTTSVDTKKGTCIEEAMACSSTLEAELPGSTGRGKRGEATEMDLLKDLPSYDRENFSRFSQGCWQV